MSHSPTEQIPDPAEQTRSRRFPWRPYFLISSVGILLLSLMSYGFYLGTTVIEKYTPLIQAAKEIQIEAATAHLWFEEIISGDRYEDISSVHDHLTQARWYATAMLEGGRNTEGTFHPLEDRVLRGEVEAISRKMGLFCEITHQRYEAITDSGIGSEIDQKYDAIFRDFTAQADKVNRKLQAEVNKQFHVLKIIQISLLLISLFSVGFILWRFHHLERQRALDLQAVQDANQQLQKALNEIWTLQGIIPICACCKKIRDEKGLWNQLEAYIHEHSEAKFSHGLCPDCYQKQMEEIEREIADEAV